MTDQIGTIDVSRETYERLVTYVALLRQWNPKINLVSRGSLDNLWTRHFIDSAQIWGLIPNSAQHLLDIGSGGGFPGLVLAIIAQEKNPDLSISLVESDQRKCAFLRTVARETGLTCSIHAKRIEQLPTQKADVMTARALADLTQLLQFAKLHLSEGGICLFPKGATWKKEMQTARDSWLFSAEPTTSETDENAVILKIGEISHV